jgi:hypothetical protein
MRMAAQIASFRGRFMPRTEARAFLTHVARRVESGFLMGRPHFRSRYAIALHAGGELAIRSMFFWASMVWWGLAWPWVLAAFHRRFAEGLLLRILEEVDASAGPAGAHVTRPPAAA